MIVEGGSGLEMAKGWHWDRQRDKHQKKGHIRLSSLSSLFSHPFFPTILSVWRPIPFHLPFPNTPPTLPQGLRASGITETVCVLCFLFFFFLGCASAMGRRALLPITRARSAHCVSWAKGLWVIGIISLWLPESQLLEPQPAAPQEETTRLRSLHNALPQSRNTSLFNDNLLSNRL